MSIYSLENFIKQKAQKADAKEAFQHESDNLLKVDLKGGVWTKTGSMVAYKGDIKFKREGILEQGLSKLIKKSFTGEGATLTKAEGQGELFLADSGKMVSILNLTNDSIFVNGNDILAFSEEIKYDVKMIRKVAGMLAGGLFNIRLEGSGYIAVTTHFEPLILQVKPGSPVITDPNATVAWSSALSPDIRTDITLGAFLGRSSGEVIQMRFEGEGFVVVQPYEEVYMQRDSS